jgi:uncharacterized OB-fold protein
MSESSLEDAADGPVRFMKQHIALDFKVRVSPVSVRFAAALADGRIIGQKCPSCGLVFVPPRTFCPMCVVAMGEADELGVVDKGTVTSFTILTPIQYTGQTEREDYALASILLDGADGTVGQQRIVDVPLDQIRMGLRVEAVWADAADRVEGAGAGFGYGFGEAVTGWRPTGEPDVDRDHFAEHVL